MSTSHQLGSREENPTIPYDPSTYSEYSEYLIDSRQGGTRIYLSQPKRNGTGHLEMSATRYAVKVVPSICMPQRKPHNVRNEALILTKLHHVNIVKITSAFYDANQDIYELHIPYIDIPLAAILSHPHFSVHPFPSHLDPPPLNPFSGIQSSNLHSALSRSVTFQLLNALAHLHTLNPPIAHRDVNPGNILLTRDGTVKLVDFGIAWDPGLGHFSIAGEGSHHDIHKWIEDPAEMCGQVATGPYRAPELMYSPNTYNPYATDLWSMGVTMALFYAPLRLEMDEEDLSSSDSSSSTSPDQQTSPPAPSTPGYTIPTGVTSVPFKATWIREPLFDATRGEIALLWSIFRVMGTPTSDSWPDFPGHQEGSIIRFRDAQKQPLVPLLPHLPSSSGDSGPLRIIERFLEYPPNRRLTATEALADPWFLDGLDGPVVLPIGYPVHQEAVRLSCVHDIDGKSWEQILSALVQAQEQLIEETMEPRDEWD